MIVSEIQTDFYPLSFGQERFWFLTQLNPGNAAYNKHGAVRLLGPLQVATLTRSINEIIKRHEILRTQFVLVNGRPSQRISPFSEFELPIIDLLTDRAIDAVAERRQEAQQIATQVASEPFDLSQGSLWRLCLLRISAEEHLLILTMHHIITDGDWSVNLFFREMALLYDAFWAGQDSPLTALPLQYKEYALWQQQHINDEVLTGHLAYWKQQLAGELPTLQLPLDRPRKDLQQYPGAFVERTFPKPLTEALKALSQAEQVPLFATLLAGFDALLYRYTGQTDICVGAPSPGRQHLDAQTTIGYFGNPVVLRTDLSIDPSFRALLPSVQQTTLDALAHQDCPFDKVVEALKPARDARLTPLFQTLFFFRDALEWCTTQAVLPKSEVSGLTLIPEDIHSDAVPYDLCVYVQETAQGLSWRLEYNRAIFDETTIERLLAHGENLFESLVAQPDQPLSTLALLSEAETIQALVQWNQTQAPYPDASVYELFAIQAAKTPNAVAVIHEDKQLTYQALNQRANQLAHYLQREVPLAAADGYNLIGLCIDRGLELTIGALGVLKAGAGYVAMDYNNPTNRLELILQDSAVQALLTTRKLLTRYPQIEQIAQNIQLICLDTDWDQISQASTENPTAVLTPASDLPQPAYVIYTSGSTGKPKGVVMAHAPLTNLIWWQIQTTVLPEQARTAQFSPLGFDISFQEMFSTWCAGGTLVMLSEETRRNANALLQFLIDKQIDHIFLISLALQQMAEVAAETNTFPTTLREVTTAGEQLQITPALAHFFKNLPNCRLHNHYGLTETHVITAFTMPGELRAWPTLPPIGRPIANAKIYILDKHQKPVPLGVSGELYLGGVSVANGYLNRPELTAERFLPNHFVNTTPGLEKERFCKTGDLAYYLPTPDGGAPNIQFLGRIDHQVKVRGFRVELGEIEVTLRQHPWVRETLVCTRADTEDNRLIAYVVPHNPLPDVNEADFRVKQVAYWEQVWDATYSAAAPIQEPALHLHGWKDSYSGQPIPKVQMSEWADSTVARILSLQPKHVLELGCGTGMLLLRLAPYCQRYVGTDLSQQALAHVQQQLQSHSAEVAAKVQLSHQGADDFTGLAGEMFDTIIINSVVELFPSMDYLVDVLQKAVAQLKPGGVIFVGDVRSYPLLETFHADVQLHQAPDSLSKGELRQRIAHQVIEETQLTVDPAFFVALQQHFPQISQVQIQLRRGRSHNEMNQYRYDAMLQVGRPDSALSMPKQMDWLENELTLPAIRTLLDEQAPTLLEIRHVPNARLVTELKLQELLVDDKTTKTVGELREAVKETKAIGIDPEDFWALSEQLPYTIYINWSGDEAKPCYDVICQRRDMQAEPALKLFANAQHSLCQSKLWAAYGNHPGKSQLYRQVEAELRTYLAANLPEYMVPPHFVVMDALPMTVGGKIDRRALPLPATRRPDLATDLVIPQTAFERQIADIWQEVLKLEIVGLHDNFFELGGHSLMAMQVASRIRAVFQTQLPVRALFEHRTIGALAKHVEALTTVQQMTKQAKQVVSRQDTQLPTSAAEEERMSEEW